MEDKRAKMEATLTICQILTNCAEILSWCKVPATRALAERRTEIAHNELRRWVGLLPL